MDEPLAGLDQQSRTKIIKLIMSECNNRTLIVITHDKEILPYMNKKINLQSLKNN
jgi:ABC-type lipoprotein export system ATPase subunit